MAFPQPVSFTKAWHAEPYPFIDPSRPELSATGKNVVVTGGATGIGYAVALAFAQAGAKPVSIVGRRADKLQAAAENLRTAISSLPANTRILHETADLLVRSEVDAALGSIGAKVGKIDVFVSNAGILQTPGPIAS